MIYRDFDDTPWIAFVRIFGTVVLLLLAMIVIVHPNSMFASMVMSR